MFDKRQKNGIILESSLQAFFFDHLLQINSKSVNPLPKETIYYSSLVMDRFGLSQEYFEKVDGRVREKVLGLKLLESGQFEGKKQQRELKDIGDTALFLCGYFSDSVNNKILDISYYSDVGQMAYSRLNGYIPSFCDVTSFYRKLSEQFNTLTNLMRLVHIDNNHRDVSDAILILDKNKLKAS